tara:strand:+ start:51 stop:557 length:507 start_codon:yes stop_codon:yes gene_type:complete
MPSVFLGLGSNLGDRLQNINLAVDLLAECGVITSRVSSVWETVPVPSGQPLFFNACIEVSTFLSPEKLLDIVKHIEHVVGRRPSKHWAPRPIDIDILLYGNEIVRVERLTIPHSHLSERPFVLLPLSEIFQGPIPSLGLTVTELLETLDYIEGAEAHRLGVRVDFSQR